MTISNDERESHEEEESKVLEKVWLCIMSLSQWFTVISTPAIMTFPDLNQPLFFYLWLNELTWIIDIIRKLICTTRPGMDAYAVAVRYIKTTLIFDVLATLPQVASFLNPRFIALKNFRLYMISLLHYPARTLIALFTNDKF